MTSRQLFKDTCSGKKTERPPFWLMRQAGRFLPEYRALKQKYSFVEITQTPELAVEATLQPIRRFDFDCAIVFSDILVIAEALGIPYSFKEQGGIRLEKTVKTLHDIEEIEARISDVSQHLKYVAQAVKMLRAELPEKAIYGFCGSPWTVACYMLQGESVNGFPKIFEFKKSNPKLFERLMKALAEASKEYAKMQIAEGIDAFQIFDSHAGLIEQNNYFETSGKWIKQIATEIKNKATSVVFANGMSSRLHEVVKIDADFYSLDSSKKLSEVRKSFDVGLQGNLPPEILSDATPEIVAQKTLDVATDMLALDKHIFNLAHGIRPDAKLENVEAMCQTLKSIKYEHA